MGNYCGKKRQLRVYWVVAAVLWTLFIWSNSMQTAVQSGAQSGGFIELIRPFLEWTPIPEAYWEFLVRKAAHMTEFAVLAGCWSGGLMIPERDIRRAAIMAMTMSVLTAAVDETIQLFVPGRAGMIRDVLIDSTGAAIAILILMGIITLVRRRRAKRN